MSANFDWSQFDTVEPSQNQSEKEFDWSKFDVVKKQEPASLKGSLGSYATGLGGGLGGIAGDVLNLLDPLGGMFLSDQEQAKASEKSLAESLGVQTTPQLTSSFQKSAGLSEPQNSLERILQQSGEFGGQEALLGTGLGGPVGAGLGLAHGSASGAFYAGLKELGMDDTWALGLTTVATLSPLAAQKLITKFKSGSDFKKAVKSVEKEIPAEQALAISNEIEKLPSGITKPRAMGAPHAEKAFITSERQKKSVDKLNEEAARITQETIEKRLPSVKKIEAGHDFESEWEKGFGQLRKSVRRANPEVDLTDVTQYLNKSLKPYRGIPFQVLDEDAKKIFREAKTLANNPQTQMKRLYDLYRINTKKIKKAYETKLVSGAQKDYIDYLLGLNRSIVSSFERTLPADSQWLKEFKNLNSRFREYKNAEKTMAALESITQQRAGPAAFKKLIYDPKARKKLELWMGKEGAAEIIQIAKDTQAAREAIMRIPTKEIKAWDHIFPLGVFIPGIQIPSGIALAKKASDYGRHAYGLYLTTPSTRRAYDQALNAIKTGNKGQYERATQALEKESQSLLPIKE